MKLTKMNLARVLGLAGLAALLLGWALAPTRAQQGSLVGGKVYAPPGTWVSYSPVQLGANALSMPASVSTASTSSIDTRGAKEATLISQCTQAYSIHVEIYDEMGTAIASVPFVAGTLGSGAPQVSTMGSESGVSNNSSTTSGTGQPVRFPQRAIGFKFDNQTATDGTCTARLFVQY